MTKHNEFRVVEAATFQGLADGVNEAFAEGFDLCELPKFDHKSQKQYAFMIKFPEDKRGVESVRDLLQSFAGGNMPPLDDDEDSLIG